MQVNNCINNNGFEVNGPKLITKNVFKDQRGFFFESWNKFEYQKHLNISSEFVQLNQSRSYKGVLRGLHYQLEPNAQGKLVNCLRGRIFDVIVDIRKNSPTYSSWIGIELNEDFEESIWIPPGFAHGFYTLSKSADVQYFVTKSWNKNFERCIVWDDKEINIKWPLSNDLPIVSEKDLRGLSLYDAENLEYIF